MRDGHSVALFSVLKYYLFDIKMEIPLGKALCAFIHHIEQIATGNANDVFITEGAIHKVERKVSVLYREQQPLDISEGIIRNIVTNNKHLLHSVNDADRKEVLQEYVEQVVIQPSNDINHYDVEITYKVLMVEARGVSNILMKMAAPADPHDDNLRCRFRSRTPSASLRSVRPAVSEKQIRSLNSSIIATYLNH